VAEHRLRPDLRISVSDYEFSESPGLLERVTASPHGYLRFINPQFAQAVCAALKTEMASNPDVNLHGDAHLEQYAITDRGRGLHDYDAAGSGPAVLDLARFGVSIRLACRANGWVAEEDSIFETFLSGYRAALENPQLTIEAPSLVERVRASFPTRRDIALARADSLMDSATLEPDAPLEDVMELCSRQMLAQHPDLPGHFFDIKKFGRLRMGIGSALLHKYLVRVEGDTDAPGDDVILEAKETRDLGAIDCISAGQSGHVLRLLTAAARIAYCPHRYVGYVTEREGATIRTYWVHSWEDNYRELSVNESFETPKDLSEIVYDVGVQLGLGHPKQIADPHGDFLRQALLTALDDKGPDLVELIRDLTRRTVAAWEEFRAEVESGVQ
jgi:hypothetical protein